MTNQETNSINGSSKKNGGLEKNTNSQQKNAIPITVEIIDKLKKSGKNLAQYVHDRQSEADSIDIYGWSRGTSVPSSVYDNLINAKLKVKRLNFLGRGRWTTCRCPKKYSTIGEQFDDIKQTDITSLEHIYVASTFQISACALLDLVSRSPKLKVLRFFGLITSLDHNEPFRAKRFLSDLERVYWPYCIRKCKPILTTLIKRNENINTFYCNGDITCDLLGADALPSLRYLSLILNENWNCKPGNPKRAYDYLQKTSHLSQARNLEALEVRTFDLKLDEDSDKTTTQKVERVFENYKLTFWEQVSRLPKLKYLAIYGAWELEKVCRELAKHSLQIELLKINLMPSSVLTAIDTGDDSPQLSMVEGIRNLKKLPQLRSLHYLCHEKLGNIDNKTVTAMKELIDLLWNLDLKICFTPDVEELVNNIIRRGNQVGKTYRILLHVEAKDSEYANCLVESALKFTAGTSLRSKLASLAESATIERFGKPAYSNFQVWGLEQIANTRDTTMFQRLQSNWNFYDNVFEMGFYFADTF